MGSDFLDYLVTDKIITPKKHSPFYTEKFCYLPDCYQINSQQKISKKKFKRSDFGLPEKSFVFCSFNHSFKIDPTIFDSWMKILKAVPKSVLWLLKSGPVTEGNLKKEAEKRDVSPKRLIFADRIPLEEHLSRLSLADLALDTRIYNGGATTCNALSVGLPVVVTVGNHYVSRMGASFLTTIDLPELIASSPEEYEKLIIDLATNPQRLKKIKNKLIKNKSTTPLFNPLLFVKNLEKAYLKMWGNYQGGQKPKQITV
jgi:protein O-GlcNAc transferase